MTRRSFTALVACLVLPAVLAGCAMGSSSPRLANPDPSANPPSTASAPTLPADGIVSVRPGDTVYALARRYGIGPRAIIEANRLTPPYLLHVGDRVILPVGRTHQVRSGDTASEIARRYGVDFRRFAAMNDLRPPYGIRVGQTLKLPAAADGASGTVLAARVPQSPPVQVATIPPPRDPSQPWSSDGTLNFPVPGRSPPTATGAAAPRPPSAPTVLPTVEPATPPSGPVVVAQAPSPPAAFPPPAASPPRVSAPDEAAARAAILAPPPRGGGRFIWPVDGRVIAAFGPREGGLHNDGINIEAAAGTQIRAAENGVVVYAGNELRGFGNLLLIKHADGWTTAYAHADTLLVRRGDRVDRGQAIATVGRTGNVDRPQLHFEIRKGPRPVDPRSELAAARSSAVSARVGGKISG